MNRRLLQLPVSGRAAFQGGELVCAVFVDLHPWLTTSTGARPSLSERAHGSGREQDGERVRARLVIQHMDDTANVTWAGQTFEMARRTSSPGSMVRKTAALSEGLGLPATQAVLVDF
ncbi:hypothetical protein C8Q80DRAFT_1352722 [Daedaleopsis nitida]|nr:hypothetical protein C8Q80DRAFT_1352722 [Daedaleopsis nitida]